jgi:hypothetical protein
MLDFLVYLLVPILPAIALLYIFGIRRFKLEEKLRKMMPFVLILAAGGYFFGETGVLVLRPWLFDCSKTLGICPFGLPIENMLVALLVTFSVALAALAFSEIEKRSKSTRQFLEYLFLLRWN